MRILVLAPQPFFTNRGTPLAVRALLGTLGAAGHGLDVIVLAEGEDIAIAGCTFTRLPRIPGFGPTPPGFSVRKLLADAVMLPVAAWRLGWRRYDLVIAVEEAAFIAAVLKPLFGTPYIYDVDSSIPEQIGDRRRLPGWVHGLLVGAERLAARRALGAITCCRALEDIVRGHAPGVPVLTLEDVSMLGPEGEDVPPEDCRFGEPVVMYVGNLEPYQGVGLLIGAMARVTRPARLVVIGGTAAHVAAHRAQAEDLGIAGRVSFLGPRPVAHLGAYLRQAAVVVSPRIQGLNTPMKVYSYLDCGRPLLATRLPTHTQVLDDDIALLTDPTPQAMAEGLDRLLADAVLRARLTRAARARVRAEFTPEAYARKLLGFIDGRIAPAIKAAGTAT